MTRPPTQDDRLEGLAPGRLDFDEFEARAAEYDRAVDASPVADRYCTRSDWIVPARHAFSSSARPWIHRFDEGWAPLIRIETVFGRTLVPFEYGWGFASPFVGPDPGVVAARFVDHALADRASWDAMFLSGLERGGPAFVTLVRRLRRRHQLRIGQPSVRRIASLDGGWDGFMARRSSKFRRNLRREIKRAADRYRITLDADLSPAEARGVYDELLRVEARSWKGMQGVGIDEGPMRRFYARMVPRLAERGALRVTRAWQGDRLVGYVLGGIAGSIYRGLQISFDEQERDHGLGNLMQAETIGWLCEHDAVRSYDLGGDLDYKRRWAEQAIETVPLLVR